MQVSAGHSDPAWQFMAFGFAGWGLDSGGGMNVWSLFWDFPHKLGSYQRSVLMASTRRYRTIYELRLR